MRWWFWVSSRTCVSDNTSLAWSSVEMHCMSSTGAHTEHRPALLTVCIFLSFPCSGACSQRGRPALALGPLTPPAPRRPETSTLTSNGFETHPACELVPVVVGAVCHVHTSKLKLWEFAQCPQNRITGQWQGWCAQNLPELAASRKGTQQTFHPALTVCQYLRCSRTVLYQETDAQSSWVAGRGQSCLCFQRQVSDLARCGGPHYRVARSQRTLLPPHSSAQEGQGHVTGM